MKVAYDMGTGIPHYGMDPGLGTFHSCLIAQQQHIYIM
jgi:hypothetical protein